MYKVLLIAPRKEKVVYKKIYKDLVSLKKRNNEYVLYCYDLSTGEIKTYMKSSDKNDIENHIKKADLVKIPYSVFIDEGKRLSYFLTRSQV